MPQPRRRALAACLAAALGAGLTGLAALPASANPAGTGLVISEVYGGGGNTSAPYNQDFVELYNPTSGSLSLNGKSIQYQAASGNFNATVAALPNTTVGAGAHYLVGLATGATGTALPTPDTTQTGINLSATTGTVYLANQTTLLTATDVPTGNAAGNAKVSDVVGYGTTAVTYEGTTGGTPARAPAPSNTTSVTRAASGADTDNNTADFTVASPPVPQNSGSPSGGGGNAGMHTIAEIQGDNTDTSPYAGMTVTTQGVVTAAYPTGGLNGFYLQTGGTPNTPDASDAIFVYGGTGGFATYPAVGSSQQVAGTVSEFNGLTEITASSVTALTPAQPAVVPLTVIPGTDCALPGTACLTGTALDAAREKHEGELYQPTGSYTVTDAYDGSPSPSTSSSFFGEIGLAAESTLPLIAPTEVIDAQATADITTRTNYNNAHLVILDDGSTTTYTGSTTTQLPWFTKTHYVRDGAAVTFPAPVVLTYGNMEWRIEPAGGQVVGDSTGKVNFAQDRPAAPENVGGDIRLATFNVLNFFPTTGNEYASTTGNTCTYYTDRAGNQITVNDCGATGPRGAANAANLQRQQDKIVAAINKLGAGIVSLEEIENSVQFGKDRDFGLMTLTNALNAAAGAGTWAYVPSPAPADLPPTADQDVIRTAFIYKPALVSTVGVSQVLVGSPAFDNAREPLAQEFKLKDAPDSQGFAVIVNHFKSKGSGNPDPNGQGASNDSRVAQANALVTFANDFKTSHNLTKVFLTGDYNAYSFEDPVQVLEAAGYTDLASTTNPNEKSYNFGGLSGSLDHVFANDAAKSAVTGVDIWNINADESVYYEYSRYNYFATDLYDSGPYRASDHNPEVVGLSLAATTPGVVTNVVASAGDTRTRVDFTAPTTGAAPTSYVVTETVGDHVGQTYPLAAGATGADITGLANGTAYAFTVTAVNDGTSGTPSAASNTVTPRVVAGEYTALTPTRIVDTRLASGPTAGAPVGAGASQELTVPVLGRGGVPASGVSAVVVNLTGVDASDTTYVAALTAPGTGEPSTSNLNFVSNQPKAVQVTVPVNSDGTITVFNKTGTIDVILDVQGFYQDDTALAAGRVHPQAPQRLLDTRDGTGEAGGAAPVGPGQHIDIQVTGQAGVPAGATAVIMNLTGVAPTTSTFVTASSPTGPVPDTSSLNLGRGEVVPNLVTVPLSPAGKMRLTNDSGTIDLVADITGYITSASDATGARYQPATQTRVLDTRTGPGPIGQVSSGQTVETGVNAPAGATGALIGLTSVVPTNATFLAVNPAGSPGLATSTLNSPANAITSNAALTMLGTDATTTQGIAITNAQGNDDILADIQGYLVP